MSSIREKNRGRKSRDTAPFKCHEVFQTSSRKRIFQQSHFSLVQFSLSGTQMGLIQEKKCKKYREIAVFNKGLLKQDRTGINIYFGGLLGSLQLLLQAGIKPGPYWPEANALTTTLQWQLPSGKCSEQATPQSSPQASRLGAWCSEHPKHRGLEHGAFSVLLVSVWISG